MEVRLAKTAGFCFGVRRAVDTVYEQVEQAEGPIYTYGPIVHNETVVQELEEKGEHLPFETVLQQMYLRDKQDIERKVSPLRCAEDAAILDTTHLDLDQAEAAMLVMIEELLKG